MKTSKILQNVVCWTCPESAQGLSGSFTPFCKMCTRIINYRFVYIKISYVKINKKKKKKNRNTKTNKNTLTWKKDNKPFTCWNISRAISKETTSIKYQVPLNRYLLSNSAEDKWMTFFPENRLWHLMQIVSLITSLTVQFVKSFHFRCTLYQHRFDLSSTRQTCWKKRQVCTI